MATSTPTTPSSSPRVNRKASTRKRAASHLPGRVQELHDTALQSIRGFLDSKQCHEAFPVSFRLIVLDTKLEVKNALQCMFINGVVSAALWNSEESKFAGMLTVSDLIHLIQWYYLPSNFESAAADVETLKLEALRDIEKKLNKMPPPLLSAHPDCSMFHAARLLLQTHARRLPLLDRDDETKQELIVSVLTQYRLLKFVAINCIKQAPYLKLQLRKLGIGTYVSQPLYKQQVHAADSQDKPLFVNPYHPIATATMSTRVHDVVYMFSERGISAVPVIDEDGVVVNLYETVDVMTLIRSKSYQSLNTTIADALSQRPPDFPGVVICGASDSLGTFLALLQKRRVHRLVVVEGEAEEREGGKRGRLLGIITLSDILRYIMGGPGLSEVPEGTNDAASPH